jgi:hypothetical protein
MTGKKAKFSGCLIQGTNPNEFQLRAANGRTYMLVPEGNVDFSSHLNHRVTVSGTRETGAAAGMVAEGTAGARGAAGTQEQIRVSSISHVGKTCK